MRGRDVKHTALKAGISVHILGRWHRGNTKELHTGDSERLHYALTGEHVVASGKKVKL
jgi:hypothetical protein